MQVSHHKVVSVRYTMKAPNGQLLESTGDGTVAYLHGAGQAMRGLEQALQGRTKGERLQFTLPVELAFGHRDRSLISVVARKAMAAVPNLQRGLRLQATTPQGPRIVTVLAVGANEVTIDANHPLAGVPLTYDVTIVDVRDATEEEIQHKHAHGPGGVTHDAAPVPTTPAPETPGPSSP